MHATCLVTVTYCMFGDSDLPCWGLAPPPYISMGHGKKGGARSRLDTAKNNPIPVIFCDDAKWFGTIYIHATGRHPGRGSCIGGFASALRGSTVVEINFRCFGLHLSYRAPIINKLKLILK